MRSNPIAKLTRPAARNSIMRDRLFSLLDEGSDKRVIWITSLPGSGKTTLVSSWIDSRKLPHIWYQVDEGDSDISTFFYYMGLAARKAAPRHKKNLPLLTQEYLQGVPTFTKRYFEKLCGRLIPRCSPSMLKKGKAGFVIVLDNFHDAPGPAFHEMISCGMDAVPAGVCVVIISRNEHPPQLSRLHANSGMAFIGWDQIKFTLDESSELLRAKEREKMPSGMAETLHDKTGGWAAGLVLMMESLSGNVFLADAA